MKFKKKFVVHDSDEGENKEFDVEEIKDDDNLDIEEEDVVDTDGEEESDVHDDEGASLTPEEIAGLKKLAAHADELVALIPAKPADSEEGASDDEEITDEESDEETEVTDEDEEEEGEGGSIGDSVGALKKKKVIKDAALIEDEKQAEINKAWEARCKK